MDARTQRPPHTSPHGGRPPRTGRAGRFVLMTVVVTLIVTTAMLVSVLYGADSGTTAPPRPGVSAVQLERWGADGPAEQLDREVQRFRNAVDAARRTTE